MDAESKLPTQLEEFPADSRLGKLYAEKQARYAAVQALTDELEAARAEIDELTRLVTTATIATPIEKVTQAQARIPILRRHVGDLVNLKARAEFEARDARDRCQFEWSRYTLALREARKVTGQETRELRFRQLAKSHLAPVA